MPKGRSGVVIFFIIILLVLAAFLYLRRGSSLSLFGLRQEAPVIPLDLQALIPPDWAVQRAPQLECDFDGDQDRERLLIYRYNSTTLAAPLAKEGTVVTFAPFGGVIYDTQAGTLKEQPDSPGPYRASNLVPYKLLPDYYPDKGQGYLGETAVDVRYAPAVTPGDECSTREIIVYGFSGGTLPTRLSVFRWEGIDAGYQGAHFAGNARVESHLAADGQVDEVVTYNRLLNHRSVLCEVEGYLRPNLEVREFIPNAAIQTIDFCYGAPSEPVYPEGVVVALLRGAKPTNLDSPRYILDNTAIPAELVLPRESPLEPINIVVLGNPSSVEPEAGRGKACTVDEIDTADKNALWCGRERVRVETRLMLDGAPRDVAWILISVAPNRPNADLYWRVAKIEMQ